MTDHTSLPAKLLEQAVRGENSEGMVTQSIPNPGIPPSSSLSSPPPRGQAQRLERRRFKVTEARMPVSALLYGWVSSGLSRLPQQGYHQIAKFSNGLKRTLSLKSSQSPIILKGVHSFISSGHLAMWETQSILRVHT